MSRLEVQAEITKLARLFAVPEDRLAAYTRLSADRLRAIRESASAAVFDDARPMLTRVAAASKLLPVSVISLVGEKIFGAMLCARVAGLIAPRRALETALKLSDRFLADVSSQIDPRSAKDVIAGFPVHRVQAVAALLIERRDYVTMGRFVDYLSRETIRQVVEDIRDSAVLLHVAFYVENKSRLNDIIDLLPESRLREIVQLCAGEHAGIWPEALALMNHVSPEWRGRIADLTANEDAEFLTKLLRLTQQTDLWDAMLPVIGCMNPANHHKLAQIPALAEVPVLRAIVNSAHSNGLWPLLLPLVTHMPPTARRSAAQVVEHLPREVLQQLIEAAGAQELWPDLIGILASMEKAEQREIVGLLLQQPDDLLRTLMQEVHRRNLWTELLPLLHDLRDTDLRRLSGLLPDGVDLAIVKTHALPLGLWPRLEPLLVARAGI